MAKSSAEIIEVVRDDLEMRELPEAVIQRVPTLVRRAIIALQDSGVFPPRINEFKVEDNKQEKRDGHGNLLYEFFFLPEDFLRLDKFAVFNTDADDNVDEKTYQLVRSDLLFTKRRSTDERKFFAITDINIDDERSRSILVLDPMPNDEDYIELRYFDDGTVNDLSQLSKRDWAPVIAKVHEIIGIKTKAEADEAISNESANRRNKQGKDSFNKTHIKTRVNFPWGKT